MSEASAQHRNVALRQIADDVVACQRCPELRQYLSDVAKTKRRAYMNETYWGAPVPGFGDEQAKLLIVGLAPAAHGANRTGRMFTGDRSGDFLYAGLHRTGFANQPDATSRDDGLELDGVFISAAGRCAPPANKPTAAQLNACRPFLEQEIRTIEPAVIMCLGGIGWNATLRALKEIGHAVPVPRPKFGHGSRCLVGGMHVLGCYHVSQQNTFTGRLTPEMLDQVLVASKELC